MDISGVSYLSISDSKEKSHKEERFGTIQEKEEGRIGPIWMEYSKEWGNTQGLLLSANDAWSRMVALEIENSRYIRN